MNPQPYTHWKVSPERLNNKLGYILGNVVLCCSEFNMAHSGWSRSKILAIPFFN